MSVIFYPGYSQRIVVNNLRVATILAITQAFPMVLTTTINHGYPSGIMVRFLIPTQFGMVELNNLNAQVLSITANTLTINLDSTNFNSFSYPISLPSAFTPPSVIPNSSGSYLPPLPLPSGNQESFEGVVYNAGVP